ncbi:MAG: NDP-hexose 2,3-dehydratase [Clostridium lundense]|nr:NDP-hexose 2,3-dehydratase [Clostridium lundense]
MIKSLLTTRSSISSDAEIAEWIRKRNSEVEVRIENQPLAQLAGWHFDDDMSLRHNSGKFFSIEGIHVETDYGKVNSWDQPIINQPEVGFLGILTKEIDGVLYFLMQSKIEPGNVNNVQISPTLQATKSNFTQVHQGKKPAYLEFFVNAKPHQILLDQLQSEQGARFLRKRNRNIIIKVDEDVELLPDFRWMTLGQIKELMYHDNMVNMDTRTVISGIDFSKYLTPLVDLSEMSEWGRSLLKSMQEKIGYYTMDENISWLSRQKAMYNLLVTTKPLKDVEGWDINEYDISRKDEGYFKVVGVKVTISSREVASWSQPLVQPQQQGLCAFIIKDIDSVPHFLVQAKLECGNYDVMELAPTVQCLTGKYNTSTETLPFLSYVLNAPKNQVLFDTLQSEEGGRFYHEQNRNMLIKVGDDFPIVVPDNYRWMTLNQLFSFLKFNNFLNIQARSLLSALKFN